MLLRLKKTIKIARPTHIQIQICLPNKYILGILDYILLFSRCQYNLIQTKKINFKKLFGGYYFTFNLKFQNFNKRLVTYYFPTTWVKYFLDI